MHAISLLLGSLALPLLTLAAPAPRNRLPSPMYPRQDNSSASCDLTNLPQPNNTLAPPSSIDPTLTLVLIALGRGTQNYTCADSTSAPTQIGAVADLFNISCTTDGTDSSLGSISEDAATIGAHFFVDTTTPDFDIIGLGNTQAKKAEDMPAPSAGQDVPWLRLEAKVEQSTSQVKQIYRLHTKGGKAPATCEGVGAGNTVEVEYEAQYWIYAPRE